MDLIKHPKKQVSSPIYVKRKYEYELNVKNEYRTENKAQMKTQYFLIIGQSITYAAVRRPKICCLKLSLKCLPT